MKYDYQYALIAVAASIILIIMIYQRRSYSSSRNRVFMSLLYCNLLGTIADLVTFWTISYPDRYPVAALYGSNMIYLLLFGFTAGTFMRYIAAMLEIPSVVRDCRILYVAGMGIESVMVLFTPWTHWIIYYDDQLVYHHGLLFFVMYLIPIGMISYTALLLILRKSRYSRYQQMTIITIYMLSLLACFVQIKNPRIDIFNLICTGILFVLYIAFENPAYDTYRVTGCYNSKAFYEKCMDIQKRHENPRLILIGVMNNPGTHSIEEADKLDDLMEKAAEVLALHFGKSVYCIAAGKFVLILPSSAREDKERVYSEIRGIFEKPLHCKSDVIKAEIRMRSVLFKSTQVSEDFVDHLIEGIYQYSLESLFSVKDIPEILWEQHRYRLAEDATMTALKKETFFLQYQPIFNLENGTFHSAEALIRLVDPELGYISPDVFIPIAEKNGSIIAIGDLVFEKVCAFLDKNRKKLEKLDFIEINVSPVQVIQRGMAERFISIMKKYDIPASAINLELTETAELISNEIFQENMRILRKHGVSFSIDDYGSGFASADYLYRLPIDIVKIDKTILWEAMKNPDALIVFKSSIRLVKQLKKKIVVEGAETREMVEMIRESGGDYIQGFYYSRPLGDEDFIRFIE